MLTELEKKVISVIQGDIPIVERPYARLAETVGVSEEQFIAILQNLCDRGVIRRFGATLRHQKSGFTANAMVAWQVAEERVHQAGRLLAAFDAVSHCYRRDPAPDWPYNLYTMVHASSKTQCLAITREMAEKAGIETFTVLFSQKELKKTSMHYFDDEDD